MFNYLKDLGILGNNARISDFILPHNKRSAYPFVDNKIITHELALKNNIPCPELYFTIKSFGEVKGLHQAFKHHTSAVIKPARGSQGNGILVLNEIHWDESREKTEFLTSRKNSNSYATIEYHISSILSGLYSLKGDVDHVLVQERLDSVEVLKRISYQGLPDIRVISFYGVPVMAMTRLPTKQSQGRGNLHQGAVGLGLRIKDGTVTGAIQNNKIITKHPDFEESVFDLKVPQWLDVLRLSSKCSELVNIKYLGVDVVIDPIKGPLLLEMNARPGLSIQLANKDGLVHRLEKVMKYLKSNQNATIDEKIQFGIDNF
jgi:alpha-L-glutamate ligase-like protein